MWSKPQLKFHIQPTTSACARFSDFVADKFLCFLAVVALVDYSEEKNAIKISNSNANNGTQIMAKIA
jgi:hypothetical protein